MAAATDKEQEEAVPKGTEFMPGVDTDQLTAAFKKERVGKPKSVLEACYGGRRWAYGPYRNAYGCPVRPYAAGSCA